MTRQLVVLCCLLALCSAVHASAASALPAPRYAIDLDAPPEERWLAVYLDYQDKFGPILAFLNATIPPDVQQYLDPIMAALNDFLPGDIGRELKGISEYPGVPFNLGQLVILNLLYELTAYCTSIVAQAPDGTGTIFHSRHLDYDIPALRDLTIEVEFKQNNATLYECTMFAGSLGCFTGMRPGGWSVSINERDQGTSPVLSLLAALEGGQSVAMFLRDLLQSVADFDSALLAVTTQPLIAPAYITLAGVKAGEGAIVTRNRTVADDVWKLDASADRWWILETNDDHWRPPLDKRRDVANAAMEALGQAGVSDAGLLSVLDTPPVFNSGTIYTTQMVPALGNVSALVRYDYPPGVTRARRR